MTIRLFVQALIILFNKDKSVIHRLMIYLMYLEVNPKIRIIENLNYSVMIIRLGMLSMSLEQILLNPNMEIAHAVILLHLIIVAWERGELSIILGYKR